MKANRILRSLGLVVTTALTITGLAGVAASPANAAAKSTVTILSTGEITSLNPLTSDGYTTYNTDVAYLTSAGFYYYDNKATIVDNTVFGSQKIVKKSKTNFQIEYTVNPGQTWSDGTPIDAVDLLLSHVTAANKYSIAAGLGDPSKDKPAFDSIGYSGPYSNHVVGLPKLSANNMKLTVKFDQPMPDWKLLAPGPSPVHALELLADGKKKLGSVADNLKAKAKFLKDFNSKNTSRLKKLGDKWTNAYNTATVTKSTNPLLLISNGGFIIQKATAGASLTLVRNPKYKSGPKLASVNPVNKVVFKIINDNAAAVQAFQNGDIDVYYNTLPSGADYSALKGIGSRVVVKAAVAGGYSHLDLRTGPANGSDATYTGPFAGNDQKAKDLRKAFLLATPRQQIVKTLYSWFPGVTPMDTQFAFNGTPEYKAITKASGVAQYSAGTQADRTAKALALVQKYYPDASDTKSVVTVRFAHYDTPTRNAITALIAAEVKKAGFEIKETASTGFFDDALNKSSEFDATMYGFSLSAISQGNSTEIYQSDGGNNVWGWSDPTVDKLAKSLSGDYLTTKQVAEKRLAIDKIVISNAWGLALYQNPTITAYIKALKNVKPAPIGAVTVWNYWEWHY